MSDKLVITVHFDLICPWCLIGKRHLRTAMELLRQRHRGVEASVEWRAHLLLPGTPTAGIPYQAFYEQRLGSKAAVASRRAQVQAAAQATGITFAFERIELMPNTLAAHQLIDCAGEISNAEQMADLIERLFTAYFMDGRNIGEIAVLHAIAAEAGLPAAPIQAALAATERRLTLLEKLATSSDEISGVPYFDFNKRLAISGAHPPAELLAAMEQALVQTSAVHPG